MSFGYRDSDWVDPDYEPTPRMLCDECMHGRECPCGGWCYCRKNDEFYVPDEDEECIDFQYF